MEALLFAALIYVATKVGDQVTDKVGTGIADGLEAMVKTVFRKVRDDPAALRVAQEWQQQPRDAARIRRLQAEVERLRRGDEAFDRRLRELEDRVGSLLDAATHRLDIATTGDDEPQPPPQPAVENRDTGAVSNPDGAAGFGGDSSMEGVKRDLDAISDRLPDVGSHMGRLIDEHVAPLHGVLEPNDNTEEIFAAAQDVRNAGEALNVALVILQEAIERYIAER